MSKLTQSPVAESALHDPISMLIAEYGAQRVFLRAARAMFSRHRPPPSKSSVNDVSAHIRRDIGLPPQTSSRLIDPRFPR